MMDEETTSKVRDAIQKAKSQGRTDEEIKQFMLDAGYSGAEIAPFFSASPISSPVPTPSTNLPAQGVCCPNCGASNSPGARFCAACGNNFTEPIPPQPTQQPPQQTPPQPIQQAPTSPPPTTPPSYPSQTPVPAYTPAPKPSYTAASGSSSGKKKIIIMAIVIAVIAVSAYVIFMMFDPASSARAECEAELKQDIMGRYGVTEAELMAAERYADMLYNDDAIYRCMREKAVEKRNAAICNSIPLIMGSSHRERCFQDVVTKNYDSSACQYLSADDRNKCYSFIACNTGQYNLCDNIPDPSDRDRCKSSTRYCSSSFYI